MRSEAFTGNGNAEIPFTSELASSFAGILEEQVAAQMPPQFKVFSGQSFLAERTCGDGACALHFVFGSQTIGGEYFLTNARAKAVEHFSESLEDMLARRDDTQLVDSICSSLWNEFMVREFQGAPTVESSIFLCALQQSTPALAREARERWEKQQTLKKTADATKLGLEIASRIFFVDIMEEQVIRPLALRFGYIPLNTDVRRLSQGELKSLITALGPDK